MYANSWIHADMNENKNKPKRKTKQRKRNEWKYGASWMRSNSICSIQQTTNWIHFVSIEFVLCSRWCLHRVCNCHERITRRQYRDWVLVTSHDRFASQTRKAWLKKGTLPDRNSQLKSYLYKNETSKNHRLFIWIAICYDYKATNSSKPTIFSLASFFTIVRVTLVPLRLRDQCLQFKPKLARCMASPSDNWQLLHKSNLIEERPFFKYLELWSGWCSGVHGSKEQIANKSHAKFANCMHSGVLVSGRLCNLCTLTKGLCRAKTKHSGSRLRLADTSCICSVSNNCT